MSTRCLIAIEESDKTCRSIYCHFDGYPDGAGLTLINHYATKERVEALLALGSLSSLGDKLSKDDPEPNARDVCDAYCRDRGEELEKPTKWKDCSEMRAKASEHFWADYVYLFREGNWYVGVRSGWKLVTEVLENQ